MVAVVGGCGSAIANAGRARMPTGLRSTLIISGVWGTLGPSVGEAAMATPDENSTDDNQVLKRFNYNNT